MNKGTWLVVGLGNPGDKYRDTRHNIGFITADALVTKHSAAWIERISEPAWLEASYTFARENVVVLKPQTYMNLSGLAIKKVADRLGVGAGRCVVISDEYNFPVGRIHLRKGGSAGGHNGLSSVITELNTTEFWRLRCGIGRDFGPGGLVDYVLSPFPTSDLTALSRAVSQAVTALDEIVKIGAERAMPTVNRVVAESIGIKLDIDHDDSSRGVSPQ